jgi:hypothetical protein
VLGIERSEVWFRALVEIGLGSKTQISIPGELRIPRPGDAEPEPKRVETDVGKIGQWFAATG